MVPAAPTSLRRETIRPDLPAYRRRRGVPAVTHGRTRAYRHRRAWPHRARSVTRLPLGTNQDLARSGSVRGGRTVPRCPVPLRRPRTRRRCGYAGPPREGLGVPPRDSTLARPSAIPDCGARTLALCLQSVLSRKMSGSAIPPTSRSDDPAFRNVPNEGEKHAA